MTLKTLLNPGIPTANNLVEPYTVKVDDIVKFEKEGEFVYGYVESMTNIFLTIKEVILVNNQEFIVDENNSEQYKIKFNRYLCRAQDIWLVDKEQF